MIEGVVVVLMVAAIVIALASLRRKSKK